MLSLLRIPVGRRKLVLFLLDALVVFALLPVAALIRDIDQLKLVWSTDPASLPARLLEILWFYIAPTMATMIVSLILFFIFDLYEVSRRRPRASDFVSVFFVCAFSALAVSTLFYIVPAWRLSRGILIIQFGLAALFLCLNRIFVWRLLVHRSPRRRVLIVGGDAAARGLLRDLTADFASEYEFIGLISVDEAGQTPMDGLRVLGGASDLIRIAGETRAELIVVALSHARGPVDAALLRDILGLKMSGLLVYELPTWFKTITGRVPVEVIEDTWIIFNPWFAGSRSVAAERTRRAIDVTLSSLFLLVLLPVLVLVALAIKLTSRGPVFFGQERLGLNRRPYRMIKFRSMVVDAEAGRGPVWSGGSKDERVTPVGRFLRRTRLDEVPNFLNVLRGEMSIVGPRPERQHFVEQLETEIPYYRLRFAVRPGLTGWAQVNFPYGASVDDARRKLQYELYYIQERSVLLDAVILLKTLQTVLLRPGS